MVGFPGQDFDDCDVYLIHYNNRQTDLIFCLYMGRMR
jgi:hypothetical protein